MMLVEAKKCVGIVHKQQLRLLLEIVAILLHANKHVGMHTLVVAHNISGYGPHTEHSGESTSHTASHMAHFVES
jgi:hypothetical protein